MSDQLDNMIKAVEHIASKDAETKERQVKQAKRARAEYMKAYVRRKAREEAQVITDNAAHKLWKTTTERG